MKTLIINTYGGSLLLAARALGQEILGCYEDAGFGQGIPMVNFPEHNYLAYRHQWPKQDLSDTFVIAHPPCSAFSVQNSSPTARGVDSKAFSCTKSVLEYAMSNRAVGIAVESVMGALSGAWWVHENFAKEYGYDVYRILQNGAMFSAQWRERFWVVFIRQGATQSNVMHWTLRPYWKTVKDVVGEHEDGPSTGNCDKLLVDLKARWRREVPGYDDEDESYFFDKQDPPHPTCGVQKLFHLRMFPERDRWEVMKDYIGTFSSGMMCYVNPNGLSPCILGGSWFYMNGRNMSEKAYKLIMGFPVDYKFPETPKNFRSNMRMYLSKGVIPQVAEWVLQNCLEHLGEKVPVKTLQDLSPNPPYRINVAPHQLADFRFRKRDWRQDTHPQLRHADE